MRKTAPASPRKRTRKQQDARILKAVHDLLADGITPEGLRQELETACGPARTDADPDGMLRQAGDRQTLAAALAETLVEKVKGRSPGTLVRGAVESLAAMILLALENMNGRHIPADELMTLCRAIEHLVKARRLDVETLRKAQEADQASCGAGRLEVVFVASPEAASPNPLSEDRPADSPLAGAADGIPPTASPDAPSLSAGGKASPDARSRPASGKTAKRTASR